MKHQKKFITLPTIAPLSGLVWLMVGCGSAPMVVIPTDNAPRPTQLSSQTSLDTITIIGASTPYSALELLAKAYSQETEGVEIVFLDSSQSAGGIEAVKEGLVELGTVTRSPKLHEADERLSHRVIARDALLVATHPSVTGIDNLTTQQLQDIYSGKVTSWKELGGPDAEIIVLDRAEDTSAKRMLREYYLGDDLENAANAIMLHRESDVIDALQSTPYSISTLSLSKATRQALSINHISLNGIEPTAPSIDSGQYGMHRTLGIVWYDTPSSTTQSFIDFIFSPAGSTALNAAGFALS